MSDQGAVSDGRASDFGLIETLLWTRENGFHLLPEHLARLAASSAALGFRYDEARARDALNESVEKEQRDAASPKPSPASREREPIAPAATRLRVRLVLDRDGAIETSATGIEPVPSETVWRVAIAQDRFSSSDPRLRHKTTRRALYENALADAIERRGADEVLFLNERDEVCESARCNLFLDRGGVLLTPAMSCGLLPGTLRARLLTEGRASETILRPDALADGFVLGNSVRGLVRAALLR